MKTLIELYDERPIENVLGTEMFHPQETIYVCPPDVAENRALHKALEAYFAHRGCKVHLTFAAVSLLNAGSVEKVLKEILQSHEDCCVDISGGTDAALFAAGSVCRDIPVITYSRKKNAFFEIRNAVLGAGHAHPHGIGGAHTVQHKGVGLADFFKNLFHP